MPSPEKFNESLQLFHVDEQIIRAVNEGYEDIVSKTPKKKKAMYFKRAVDIMTEHMALEKLQEIFEWNACCKGGAREKKSKEFAKKYGELPLDEKIKLIKEVPYMGEPVRNADGTITVHAVYNYDGENFQCACSNYSKLKRDFSVSKNYCFCCAGHFKHHYEIMLGIKLETLEIVSSPLDSNGDNPCIIKYMILL